MSENPANENIDCPEYRPVNQYSHLHEFIDNLPYLIMIVLGSAIFFIGLKISLWRWTAAALYVLYGIVGAFWIITFVCPYCHFFGTRNCPCGYGQIAAIFLSKKDDNRFAEKFKKHILVIVPLWILPILGGAIIAVLDFSWPMLALLVAFALNSYVILPILAKKYGCAHCCQKQTCPWMRTAEN